MGIVTAVCISLFMPVSALADENTLNDELNINGIEQNVSENNDGGNSGDKADPKEYAVSNTEKDTTVTHSENINTEGKGILADNGATVNQTGDVNAGDSAVVAVNGSNISVTGDVNGKPDGVDSYSAVEARDSQININGDISSTGEGVEGVRSTIDIHGDITAATTGAYSARESSLTIEGDVNVVNTEKDFGSAEGITAYKGGSAVIQGNVNTTVKDTNEAEAIGVLTIASKATVNGNVNVTAEGKQFASATGVVARTYPCEAKGSVVINGDVSVIASSQNIMPETVNPDDENIGADATGILVGVNYTDYSNTVVVNGNVSAITTSPDGNNSASGIKIRKNYGDANVTVVGDVHSNGNGIEFVGSKGDANIIVDGTLRGEEAAIYTRDYYYDGDKVFETGDLNVTVWQIKSDSGNLVKAYSIDEFTEKSYESVNREEEILKNINYIIRTDKADNGTITLSGTTLVGGYDTAHESQEVVIKVETASGYKLDAVKNGSSTLTKNADGTYTLVVPRGGGVQLSAVLSAIKQSGGGSSSGSGGGSGGGGGSGSFSGQAGSNDGTTTQSSSGATVTTVSSEANGVKTSTATVSIGGKTATIETTVTFQDGKETELRYVSGDIAGVTFAGVGTVSADGTSVTTADGQVYKVTDAPMLLITENGRTKGCFFDTQTNSPISTGDMAVIYQLGADGQLHAHWMGSNGYFYTGLVYIAGHMFTFDDEGIMLGME